MDKALLQQALDALENHTGNYKLTKEGSKSHQAAIAALEAAIAQPVPPGQDPIYQYQLANGHWIDEDKGSYDYNVKIGQAVVRALYASPQVAQPVPPYPVEPISKYGGPEMQSLILQKLAQPVAPAERNFCETCGKRLSGSEYIHTCTPPESKA